MSITPGFKAKRKLIIVALKRPADTKGEDYIAAGAPAIAMQTKGVSVDPWITEQISRDLDDGLNGAQPVIHTGEMITVSGAIEMAGSGVANTPVAYAPLIEMSGFDVNVAVPTEVSHKRILTAADETDGTVYFHWEGEYHILLAGKTTLTTAAKIGEIGYINFEAKGIYGGTVEGAIPAADFSAFTVPQELSKQNTSFSLDGQLFNMIEFEMAQNNTIEYDEGTEQEQIFIDDWAPEGKVVIEKPNLSTFDPFAIARTNIFVPYEFIQGLSAGKIFKQASSGVQIMSIKPGEHKGKATYELTLREIRGNDSVLTTQ
jgi:hypothetical protein